MSFVDLATLALHRRNEMEARIHIFLSKCDHAVKDISKLKMRAQNFVHHLNCDPSELKERFLNCMKQLDEYIYLITDFNLSISKLEETVGVEYAPVHDTTNTLLIPTPVQPAFNIMDVLSEPTPSTSTACANHCPMDKPRKTKVSRAEQTLILFSSASTSSESVPVKNFVQNDSIEKKEQEVQCEIEDEVKKIAINDQTAVKLDLDVCNLPAQTMLQTDHDYPALIMNIDGASFFIITEKFEEAQSLVEEMTDFYTQLTPKKLNPEELTSLTYCAFLHAEVDCYYRALFLRLVEEEENTAEVFLVDTGEMVLTPSANTDIQPLAAQFCASPPFARCCHLAGVEMLSLHDSSIYEKQEEFMKKYLGHRCHVRVDDNSSESLGVYVILSEAETLNEVLVKEGLAISTEEPSKEECKPPKPTPAIAPPPEPTPTYGPPPEPTPTYGPPREDAESEIDILDCPEYDDAVVAVTGHDYRDDADICKHYKGGSEKTCFKGARCTKKHIMKHPDGWTLDRVEVAKFRPAPLPAPGTWHKAHVTSVCHFDRVYVQLIKEKEKDELPSFGVVLPPMSLDSLVRDMNTMAARMAYKPLTLAPAPNEVVAALYPQDNQWYRAKVLSTIRPDQNVEVMYVDYGNVVWVTEDMIRILPSRYSALPIQAVRCSLAGVHPKSRDSRQWAEAKQHLTAMALGHTLDARVIDRDYDEITVELYDSEGYSIAEQLAVQNLVELQEYQVVDDSQVKQKQIVP